MATLFLLEPGVKGGEDGILPTPSAQMTLLRVRGLCVSAPGQFPRRPHDYDYDGLAMWPRILGRCCPPGHGTSKLKGPMASRCVAEGLEAISISF